MTKKDYELLARVIRGLDTATSRIEVAHNLAAACEADNARFDRTRFLVACNPTLAKR